jgi:hypothetical protein
MIDMLYSWITRVGSEGGPLLICDADEFTAWTGAIHDDDWQLDPSCDLARANAVLYAGDDELDAAPILFGPGDRHAGLLWEMDGAGVAEIATATASANAGPAEPSGPAATETRGLLIMRSWVNADAHDAPRRYVTGLDARAVERTVADLDVPTGRIAVVWAATGAGEVADLATRTAGALDEPMRLDVHGIRGVGALLRVAPGRYQASHGIHDGMDGRYAPANGTGDGDWSCRWLRLDRQPV